MAHYLAQNIRFLRKKQGFTQEELAGKLGLNRAALGSYEEGRAEPRLPVLQLMAQYFSCTLDELLHDDFSSGKKRPRTDKKGQSLRVLPVVVDKEEKERIVVVPVKAAAGYLEGFSDSAYIEQLPTFNLPLAELGKERSYRLFQIKGDSMLPVPDGAYILTEYVQDWTTVKNDACYVLITHDEGVVYKRVVNRFEEEDTLLLKSDNQVYTPYTVQSDAIAEIWKARGYISMQLPGSGEGNEQVMQVLLGLRQDIRELKEDRGIRN